MKKLSLLLAPVLLVAGTVSHVLEFSPSSLGFSEFEGYDVVTLEQGFVVPDPGKPCLPQVNLTLVLPSDASVSDVRISPLETTEVPGSYEIIPCQEPRPLSSGKEPAFVPPDPAVYSSAAAFPADAIRSWNSGSAAGFRLASVNVCPFEYLPLSKRLRLHTRLLVTVSYAETGSPATLTQRQLERAVTGLSGLVANPEQLDRFAPATAETDVAPVDYLVITTEQMLPLFAPFMEYRISRGLRVEARTTEWIDQNCEGRDLQEKIRNAIRDYFQNRGISYVLLAGDNSLVPGRRIRVSVSGDPGDIPTDLYYADLDYSWDSNHNDLFGEMDDSVDLYADVMLGRASVDNAAEVETFIRKVKNYEQDPATDYVKRTLLPSGWLWKSRNYHGRLVNDAIANITPSGWPDVKMEDSPRAVAVADSFDNGFAFFDPAGHGNESGVYDESGSAIYTSGLARKQHNDRQYTIMTSLACNPGNFEAEDCLAENAHNAPDGGCIGVMMNSRYGWGTPPSMGPSELLCIRFYDFLLQRGNFELGTCHSRSRETYSGSAQFSTLWRWCMTEFNLLGDPALDVWTEIPSQMSVAAPDSVLSGEQTIHVSVSNQYGPVSDALVCAWKENETYAAGRTNGSGVVSLDIHPVTTGTLKLTASLHNVLPESRDVAVLPGVPEPLVTFGRASVSDSGQVHANGILEPGETGRLMLVLHNRGSAAATDVRVTLQTITPGLSIPDSVADFGTIGPEDSVLCGDFVLAAAPGILPGSKPEILAQVHSNEADREFAFSIRVGYPGRVTAEIDTGACILTVTSRGSIGFDTDEVKNGCGFKYPRTDTSCFNIASFCLANSPDYVVDRFHNTAPGGIDNDWQMTESLYTYVPIWNSRQLLSGAFSDAGHPGSRDVSVTQYALGTSDSGYDNFVVLLYDLVNAGSSSLNGLYSGILADFDVVATDRFHDVCHTSSVLRTAYARNVGIPDRVAGVKLLYPSVSSHEAVIDHSVYVYPDSGLTEDMKYRILSGSLGVPSSDRPYNWSVSVSTGPFDLACGDTQRLAFAVIGASDSAAYLQACEACQQWFDNNSGVLEPSSPASSSDPLSLSVAPNPFVRAVTIRLSEAVRGPVSVRAFNTAGRMVADVYRGTPEPGQMVSWLPRNLPAGVYVLKLEAEGRSQTRSVTLLH